MTERAGNEAPARRALLDEIARVVRSREKRSVYLAQQVPYRDETGVEWVVVALRHPTRDCRTYHHIQCDIFRHAREFGETVPRSSSVFLRAVDDETLAALHQELTAGAVLF